MKLLPNIRVIRISPDLKTTNELLERIAAAEERQAAAFEGLIAAIKALYGYDPDVVPLTDAEVDAEEAAEAQQPPLEPDLERLAIADMLEASGVRVPDDFYREIGIEPPTRRVLEEPDGNELPQPQPESAPQPEPPTARRPEFSE